MADLPVPMCCTYIAAHNSKVYVTGCSEVNEVSHQVYVYDINTDHWDQLPVSGHYFGIPHIIGGKLTIIGGRLSATEQRTNKVSTFDEASQTWISYYPDMLSVRSKPGVVTHGEYVIVVGGINSAGIVMDDIEILNWPKNTGWRMVSMTLPVPMCDISLTISGDYITIVNYYGKDSSRCCRKPYKMLMSDILTTQNSIISWIKPNKWLQLTPTPHFNMLLIPNSHPVVILGGLRADMTSLSTDIKRYDSSNSVWKNMRSSLTFGRATAAVAAINNNAIIVIGGCTNGKYFKSTSLTTVELGQAELLS